MAGFWARGFKLAMKGESPYDLDPLRVARFSTARYTENGSDARLQSSGEKALQHSQPDATQLARRLRTADRQALTFYFLDPTNPAGDCARAVFEE
jgi:hypothetical protein